MNIVRIFAIATNGFREVIRDKILYVLVFFVLLLLLASRILPSIAVSADAKILLDLGIGAINLLGAIVAIFVGTGLINKEIEKRTVLILVPKPLTTTPDACLTDVAQLMLEKHIKRLPVVDTEHKLVGIITRHDLVRALRSQIVPDLADNA